MPVLFAALLTFVGTASPALAQSPITALRFAPRGDAIVAGSQAGLEIRTWPSLEIRQQASLGSWQIHDLSFSPDGNRLLIVGGFPSESGEWRVVAWPELTELAANSEHDDVIYAAVWLSENEFVTAAADNRVIEWQALAGQGREVRRSAGHSRRVLCVEALKQSHSFVTAGVDQSLRVWPRAENSATAAATKILDHHTGVVRDLAARPGEHALEMLASASADKTVRLWQPTIGRLVRFARLAAEPVSIAWTLDGQRLAAGCIDGKLRLINPDTVQVEAEIDAIDGWIYEVVAAPDGSFVVGGTAGKLQRVVLEPNPD